MRQTKMARLILLASLLAIASPATPAADTSTYNVSINTSPLVGHPAGPFYLFFSMTDGSGLAEGNNTVTINNFNFSDGSSLGNPSSLGGVSGDLGSTISMTDTSRLNFFSEAFSAGQSLSFTITVTSNLDDGPIPDGFAFYILDNVGRPVPTLSPASDYFIGLPLGVSGATPLVFGSDVSRSPSVGNPILIPAPTLTSDTTPPVSTGALSPVSNGNGWNNTSVTVTLSATDNEPGGTGVKQITYSATGAQTIATTVVNGASTSFTISAQGITTISFFSTDLAGNIETPKTLTIQIGALPAITSANSAMFTFGTLGSFTVAATGFPTPTLSATGVPTGVTLVDNGNGTASLSETTAAAGTYLLTISASNVVGSPATQSFTLTVNRANQTITFSGVPASASFGQGPFNLTASATSGLPVLLVAMGNCSLSANSLSLTAIGSCTITATQTGNGNYNAAPSLSPSFPIGQASTATTVTVSPGTVKYTDYTTLAATVSPASAGGQALTGTVQFFLNGNAVSSPAVINSSGGATLSQLQVNLSAASYPVKAVFSSTNQNFAGSTGTTTENVTQENAFILYSGDTIAQVGTSLNLRATVWDSAATGYPGVNPESGPTATIGDITKIWIAFDIYPAGSCGSGTPFTRYAPVALTGTPGIGTATTALSSSSEVSYCVVSRLVAGSAAGTNLYYTAPNAEAAGLDFYVNSGQFATGGGWVNDPTGSHGNFGFNARYNSTGSPKGQMVYVYRGLYNGVLADFIIKSNALNALQFTGTTYPISATLQGKANVQVNRASDGFSLFSAGNYTFSATVTDSGQNDATGKQFSLTVYASNGVPYHQVASNTALQGGNVVVHSQ